MIKRRLLNYLRPISGFNPLLFTRIWRFVSGYQSHLEKMVAENSANILKIINNRRGFFIDLGVNEGVVMAKFCKHLQNSEFEFVGFEPQQELIDVAKARNPQATIINAAVSTKAGIVDLYIPKRFGHNFCGATTIVKGKIKQDNLKRVTSVRCVDFIEYLRSATINHVWSLKWILRVRSLRSLMLCMTTL